MFTRFSGQHGHLTKVAHILVGLAMLVDELERHNLRRVSAPPLKYLAEGPLANLLCKMVLVHRAVAGLLKQLS